MASFFAVAVILFRHSVRDGLPLYLTNTTAWVALAKLLAQTKGAQIVGLSGEVRVSEK